MVIAHPKSPDTPSRRGQAANTLHMTGCWLCKPPPVHRLPAARAGGGTGKQRVNGKSTALSTKQTTY